MARKQVERYSAGWHHASSAAESGDGYLYLQFADGTHSIARPGDIDFKNMLDLLRNETPVYYDPDGRWLSTEHEPVGEAESS